VDSIRFLIPLWLRKIERLEGCSGFFIKYSQSRDAYSITMKKDGDFAYGLGGTSLSKLLCWAIRLWEEKYGG